MEGSVQNLGFCNSYSACGVTNPYLNFVGSPKANFDSVYTPLLPDIQFDCADFSYTNPEIENKYIDVLNKQGVVGKAWDSVKNLFGSKMGSKAVTKKLELYKKGLVSEEEIIDTVNKYAKGQQKALDFVADWGSTIAGAGAFALAMPLAGVSIAIPLCLAGAAGALFKTSAKRLDAYSAGREYKTGPYDVATGAISGLLSPIVNGVGNAVMKKAAGALGVNVLGRGAGRLASRELGDIIKHFALYPKQKLEGTALRKLAAWGAGKAVRGIAKFGGAFALRQYVFAVFSQDAISKTILMNSPIVKVFGQEKILDQLEKNKGKEIDFSNNIYACMATPAAEQEKMQHLCNA